MNKRCKNFLLLVALFFTAQSFADCSERKAPVYGQLTFFKGNVLPTTRQQPTALFYVNGKARLGYENQKHSPLFLNSL